MCLFHKKFNNNEQQPQTIDFNEFIQENANNRLYVYGTDENSINLMRKIILRNHQNNEFLEDFSYTGKNVHNQILYTKVAGINEVRKGSGIIFYNADNALIDRISKKTGIPITNIFNFTRKFVSSLCSLYRYTSFVNFSELVVLNKLHLSKIDDWDDKYEGYIYKAFTESDYGRQAIIYYCNLLSSKPDPSEIKAKLKTAYDNARCMCLCGTEDSIAMWSSYDKNHETIMLSLNVNELINLSPNRIIISQIDYMGEELNLSNLLQMSISDEGINKNLLFGVKRDSFSYEDEYRLFYYAENPSAVNELDVPDLAKIIKNVLVQPLADDMYVQKVGDLCAKYNIPFGGRSKAFEFKLIP